MKQHRSVTTGEPAAKAPRAGKTFVWMWSPKFEKAHACEVTDMGREPNPTKFKNQTKQPATHMQTNDSKSVLIDEGGRKLAVYIATITPIEAEELLQKMAHNRPRKVKKVDRIAAAILDGKYMLNGQALIIDSAGSPLDGQHRLAACVQAGKPIRTLIVEGVATSVFPTLDLFERKLSEILVAEYGLDQPRAGTTASAINLCYVLRTTKNIHTKDFPSTWTALDFYNAERMQLDQRVTEAEEKLKNKIIPTSRIVALWHEFSSVAPERARCFFMAMCGLNHEVAIFNELRELFLADIPKPAKRRTPMRLKVAWCIKAFNSSLSGEGCQFRKMKKKESFPTIIQKEHLKAA